MVGDEIRHARRDLKYLAVNETTENIEQKQRLINSGVSSEIACAAMWLYLNSEAVRGNPLLELMARFSISVRDAVEASKHAYALRYGAARAK